MSGRSYMVAARMDHPQAVEGIRAARAGTPLDRLADRVAALLAHLRPVEADFLAVVAACDDGAEWNPDGLVDPAFLAHPGQER